ncbi:hypothetical protein RHGRI_005558 [Rhododendron griersonianum]|uniref:NAC domain-containing protein n=1 Tax=Rhododendron griersonianum TaxID=479676 RepID=A0AAV6LD59_9ERIC|nr:hypothetical protein RHGRI_005558 [Rhododendron griersonianum]
MNLPSDYRFRPTDKELLDYLKKKSKDEALPCDVVIEREIYGVGDKAPWQIFTDEDPWQICRTRDRKQNKLKTEGTIYVLTTLITTSEKEIIRTAGCGSWNGGTALEQVVDMDKDDISVIGYKRMLRFQITNESGAKILQACENRVGGRNEDGLPYCCGTRNRSRSFLRRTTCARDFQTQGFKPQQNDHRNSLFQ